MRAYVLAAAMLALPGCELLAPALSVLSAVNASRVAAGAAPLSPQHPIAAELQNCDAEVKAAVDAERQRVRDVEMAERVADLEARVKAAEALAAARDTTTAAVRRRASAQADDWAGVYRDGKLVSEGHSIDAARLAGVMKGGPFRIAAIWHVDQAWLLDRGDLPSDIADVKRKSLVVYA